MGKTSSCGVSHGQSVLYLPLAFVSVPKGIVNVVIKRDTIKVITLICGFRGYYFPPIYFGFLNCRVNHHQLNIRCCWSCFRLGWDFIFLIMNPRFLVFSLMTIIPEFEFESATVCSGPLPRSVLPFISFCC